MNKRFAQILTDATDPRTGVVDRARLFSALEADPSDPTAAMFDAAAFTFETVEGLKSTLSQVATVRVRELLAEFDAVQRDQIDRLNTTVSLNADTYRELRRWAEGYGDLAASKMRDHADALRQTAVNAVANATHATRAVENTIRNASEDLLNGQKKVTENWKAFQDEATKITGRIATASRVLLFIAFATGMIAGVALTIAGAALIRAM
jgi:hypothetical protein